MSPLFITCIISSCWQYSLNSSGGSFVAYSISVYPTGCIRASRLCHTRHMYLLFVLYIFIFYSVFVCYLFPGFLVFFLSMSYYVFLLQRYYVFWVGGVVIPSWCVVLVLVPDIVSVRVGVPQFMFFWSLHILPYILDIPMESCCAMYCKN